MATKILFTLLLSQIILCYSLVSGNQNAISLVDDQGVPKYSYVCNPERFKMLGLDMAEFAFCDKSLPYNVRAKDLVDRLTLQEKAAHMGHGTSNGTHRFGIPKYKWWSEALHGVSDVGPGTFFDELVPGATSFPTVILTTASFNKTLWNTIGKIVSTEARAMYNLGRAGLTFWSPTINVVRDPRWGRTMETPGEDPFVVGSYAVNYVRGLQDIEGQENTDDPNSRPLKVSACCKHFSAYDVDKLKEVVVRKEKLKEVDRHTYDAKVAEQDMVETFNRPFEMCVKDGDVSSVMCTYNRVNGIPTCADSYLLKKLVREDWNLHGYVVADCDSIETMVKDHKWLNYTIEEASAHVLKAGLDLDCGKSYLSLVSAVNNGRVRESEMDKSLNYLYVTLMRLGFFDGIPSLESLDKKDICSPEHMELAAEAARQGIVLLKNDNQTLPLDPASFKSVSIIGPHANATQAMLGNYAGIPCNFSSPLEAFSAVLGDVTYSLGCNVTCPNNTMTQIHSAVNVSKKADVTLLFMGLGMEVEQEGDDRENLLLPGLQTHLVNEVAEAAKGPVILIIMSATGVDVSFAKVNPKIQSILWVGYPGEQGGRAIADVVLGNYNPGGRLPITWYDANYVDQIPMTSMSLRPVGDYPGRTYKFYNGTTIYPFGYGLSYTSFKYEQTPEDRSVDIKLNRLQHCHDLSYNHTKYKQNCSSISIDDLTCDEEIAFEVKVTNVGKRDGSEVVLVYSVPPEGINGTHFKQVVGFERVYLQANESKNVKFVLNVCQSFNIVNVSGYRLLPAGLHKIVVGDNVLSIPVNVSYSRE